MIISINQPAYLPWLGYFDRIAKSDLHVVLDHVQFEKNSFTNRNRIRSSSGRIWLTVPVKTKGRFMDLAINQIEIAGDELWQRKHWKSIEQHYARTPYFETHKSFFEHCYCSEKWTLLNPLMKKTNRYLLECFGIDTPIVWSSQLDVRGTKDQLILNLCRSLGATCYISGPLGRRYLDPRVFEEAGISLIFHDYDHPTYRQAFPGFEPCMSSIDLLFNHGPESRRILTQGLNRANQIPEVFHAGAENMHRR